MDQHDKQELSDVTRAEESISSVVPALLTATSAASMPIHAAGPLLQNADTAGTTAAVAHLDEICPNVTSSVIYPLDAQGDKGSNTTNRVAGSMQFHETPDQTQQQINDTQPDQEDPDSLEFVDPTQVCDMNRQGSYDQWHNISVVRDFECGKVTWQDMAVDPDIFSFRSAAMKDAWKTVHEFFSHQLRSSLTKGLLGHRVPTDTSYSEMLRRINGVAEATWFSHVNMLELATLIRSPSLSDNLVRAIVGLIHHHFIEASSHAVFDASNVSGLACDMNNLSVLVQKGTFSDNLLKEKGGDMMLNHCFSMVGYESTRDQSKGSTFLPKHGPSGMLLETAMKESTTTFVDQLHKSLLVDMVDEPSDIEQQEVLSSISEQVTKLMATKKAQSQMRLQCLYWLAQFIVCYQIDKQTIDKFIKKRSKTMQCLLAFYHAKQTTTPVQNRYLLIGPCFLLSGRLVASIQGLMIDRMQTFTMDKLVLEPLIMMATNYVSMPKSDHPSNLMKKAHTAYSLYTQMVHSLLYEKGYQPTLLNLKYESRRARSSPTTMNNATVYYTVWQGEIAVLPSMMIPRVRGDHLLEKACDNDTNIDRHAIDQAIQAHQCTYDKTLFNRNVKRVIFQCK